MSSRTSSRSTLTIVPSTMSPSLKYLMVRSMAARKSSADPMSLMATCGAVAVGVDMWWGAPEGDWSELAQDPGREPVRVSKAAARGWDSFHPGDLERRPEKAMLSVRRPDECGLLHSETAQTHSARSSLRHGHSIGYPSAHRRRAPSGVGPAYSGRGGVPPVERCPGDPAGAAVPVRCPA